MISVTGPESTGTRYVTRILTQAGGIVRHWPLPQGNIAKWLPLQKSEAVIIMVRDVKATICSQVESGHVRNEIEAQTNIQKAYSMIISQISTWTSPWWLVSYESLGRPEAILDLCARLNLNGYNITESWIDANSKYYDGPILSNHKNIHGLEVSQKLKDAHRISRRLS